ncbi:hypothetical protein PAXINDRAFT_17255 [Paxillus involutus ATCC 200175]|uniref:Unplaced genomic scaffold PAXINscaffold_122, whole genome shotgun sequence n=1 Tax=Paxillus involutus ATCC 200175 TaxID=664439 RepID=A0A0C9TPG7_PAXIN|nr:hypothetical protein PAXINDRAFT_17255 [Paxillus involutus ATCC 200175]
MGHEVGKRNRTAVATKTGSPITHGCDANRPHRVTLILHLKWFLYDVTAGSAGKVSKQVLFTPKLEIGSDVMVLGKKNHSTRHKLFGRTYLRSA